MNRCSFADPAVKFEPRMCHCGQAATSHPERMCLRHTLESRMKRDHPDMISEEGVGQQIITKPEMPKMTFRTEGMSADSLYKAKVTGVLLGIVFVTVIGLMSYFSVHH